MEVLSGSSLWPLGTLKTTTTRLMKPLKLLIAGFCCLGFSCTFADEKQSSGEFKPLIQGDSLEGWHNPYEWGKVELVDGEVQLTGDRKFFLVTDKKYGDFVFEGEVLLPEGKANSGFMFRAHAAPGRVYGYQTEVDGDTNRMWSGGLYDEGRRKWFISPIKGNKESIEAFRKRAGDTFKRNDWNTHRITCKGNRITIEVNGVVTTDIEDDKDSVGGIGIQHHGEKGKVYKFRNLRIKELD